jgi:hypothetical protein
MRMLTAAFHSFWNAPKKDKEYELTTEGDNRASCSVSFAVTLAELML